MKRIFLSIVILISCFTSKGQEQNNILQQIEEEGMQHSQVMDLLSSLVDVHSPRLSGSKAYYDGAQWVQETMQSWGCKTVLEPYEFPTKGWEVKSFSIALTSPRFEPIIGYPAAWTGSTKGVITDTPLLIDVFDIETLKKHSGALKGRILMHSKAEPRLEKQETIISDEEIKQQNEYQIKPKDLNQSSDYVIELLKKDHFDAKLEKLMQFLRKEEVGAILLPSIWDNHVIEVSESSFHHLKNVIAIPWFIISKETYQKITGLLNKKIQPKISVSSQTEFYNKPEYNVNVLTDFEGADPNKKEEIVLAGAHFDTWHGSGNASDNNAGVATLMEAIRILKKLNIKPKRTIRTGFWGGEEQEFYGSISYLKKHLGNVTEKKYKDEHSKLSAYYNIDSGGGAIRGFFLQGNKRAQTIVQPWEDAFKKWKLETITLSPSGGSDHLIFDAANIPCFDTFQDPSLYWTKQHHTNLDEIALIDEETMKRNAVIMATFIYKTAMLDHMMPRK